MGQLMRSGNPLHKFACRFVAWVLWHEFSANGKVKNLLIEAFRCILKPVSRRAQQVSKRK